jgi:ribosomal protein S24E
MGGLKKPSLASRTTLLVKIRKELLLDKILADFQLLNPNEKTCSFQHVKKELAEKYDIKTRTISNLFN